MEINKNNLYTLLKSNYLHQVEMAKTLLEQHGIQTFIFDRNIDNVIGTAFIEGYRLVVSMRDYEQAKKILEESTNNSD